MNAPEDETLPSAEGPAPHPAEVGGGVGDDQVERLSTAECWQLVEARSYGRLAVEGLDGMPDVFPLNYTVHDGSIYIRSAPGSKLRAITVHPVAAFEIDGEDEGFHWSVVLRGSARRLAIDTEIRDSGVDRLRSASPTRKYHYICVTPSSISGRRFAAGNDIADDGGATERRRRSSGAQEPPRFGDDTGQHTGSDRLRAEPGISIPHYPPR